MDKDEFEKSISEQLGQFIGQPNTPETLAKMQSVLIPMIRKVMPTVIAHDIVGVQPMDLFPPKWNVITDHGYDIPEDHHVITVVYEVGQWIQEQPVYMWKHLAYDKLDGYIISDQLLMWLKLRWS